MWLDWQGFIFVAALLVGVLPVVRNFFFISFNDRENGGTWCLVSQLWKLWLIFIFIAPEQILNSVLKREVKHYCLESETQAGMVMYGTKNHFFTGKCYHFFLEQYLILPLWNDNAVCSLPYDLLLVNPSHLFSVPVAAYKHCKASKMKRSSGMSFITDLCKCESRNVCWFIAAC